MFRTLEGEVYGNKMGMFLIVCWLLSIWAAIYVYNYRARRTIPQRIEQVGRGVILAMDSMAAGEIENPFEMQVVDEHGVRYQVGQRNNARAQRFNYTLQCVFEAKSKFGLLKDTTENRGMLTRWLLRHLREKEDLRDTHRVSIREKVLATYFLATQDELDGLMLNRSKAYRDRRWVASNAARKSVLPSISDITSVLSGSRPADFASISESKSYGMSSGTH